MTEHATVIEPYRPASVEAFAVGGFLARYPAKTRQGYGIAIRQWFDFCHLHDVEPLSAARGHIEAWARHLEEERGLKKASVAAKLNAICGLYKFAADDGFIAMNPAANVRRPKIHFQSSTNGLSRPQFADLLAAAEKESDTTHAMICLLGLNGLRIGECLAADIEHLGNERGYRTLHLPHRKGGKIGTLSLAVRTTWAIEKALDGRTTGPLLVGQNGHRLVDSSARRTLRRLCKQIGVTKRITPHSLRHTFVTMALDAGVSERDIIDSTGHSDSAMVRYYDRHRGAIERNATHAVAAFVGSAA